MPLWPPKNMHRAFPAPVGQVDASPLGISPSCEMDATTLKTVMATLASLGMDHPTKEGHLNWPVSNY